MQRRQLLIVALADVWSLRGTIVRQPEVLLSAKSDPDGNVGEE